MSSSPSKPQTLKDQKKMPCYSCLPWQIVDDIFSRLPVKSLLRFRCISTHSLRLIDSSDFVKSHLDRAAMRNNINDLFLVLRDKYRHNCHSLLTVSFDPIINNNNNISGVPVVHPEVPNGHTVCGSCNGLVCLSAIEFGIPSVVLWNSSTRNLRKLPQSGFMARPFNGQVHMTYGFGYDHVNDDYKVVRITTILDAENICNSELADEVDVYSLNSNSWRSVHQKPPHNVHFRPSDLQKGILAGGAIHWADFGRNDITQIRRIIAFDLVAEEYRFVPLSENLDSEFPVSLKSFDGCLSVICIDFVRDIKFAVDIWVMKEYGVKESWTKLISLADPLPIISALSLSPLAYSDDRSEILLHYKHDENKFAWFSLEGKKLDYTVGITDVCDIDACLRSLVSVNESCKQFKE